MAQSSPPPPRSSRPEGWSSVTQNTPNQQQQAFRAVFKPQKVARQTWGGGSSGNSSPWLSPRHSDGSDAGGAAARDTNSSAAASLCRIYPVLAEDLVAEVLEGCGGDLERAEAVLADMVADSPAGPAPVSDSAPRPDGDLKIALLRSLRKEAARAHQAARRQAKAARAYSGPSVLSSDARAAAAAADGLYQQAESANRRAADLALCLNNDGRDLLEIDLHGLAGREAVDATAARISLLLDLMRDGVPLGGFAPGGGARLRVITGRGSNSRGGEAVLPRVVESYLIETRTYTTLTHVINLTVVSEPGVERDRSYSSNQYALVEKTNQDSWAIVEDVLGPGFLMASVADGHGQNGERVSQYVVEWLSKHLSSGSAFLKEVTKSALKKAFFDCDAELKAGRIDCELSGTTVALALLHNNSMTVAHVGDSRVVCGIVDRSGALTVKSLTRDHKPSLVEERERILQRGGKIQPLNVDGQFLGPERVWLASGDLPGIAMTRSVGDCCGHRAGLTAECDVSTIDILTEWRYIVVCSDGITEFMSDEELMRRVHRGAHEGKAPHVVAREVVEEARARWSEREGTVDDCTIVLMFLEPNPTYKGVGLRSNPIAMKRTSTTEVPHAAVFNSQYSRAAINALAGRSSFRTTKDSDPGSSPSPNKHSPIPGKSPSFTGASSKSGATALAGPSFLRKLTRISGGQDSGALSRGSGGSAPTEREASSKSVGSGVGTSAGRRPVPLPPLDNSPKKVRSPRSDDGLASIVGRARSNPNPGRLASLGTPPRKADAALVPRSDEEAGGGGAKRLSRLSPAGPLTGGNGGAAGNLRRSFDRPNSFSSPLGAPHAQSQSPPPPPPGSRGPATGEDPGPGPASGAHAHGGHGSGASGATGSTPQRSAHSDPHTLLRQAVANSASDAYRKDSKKGP